MTRKSHLPHVDMQDIYAKIYHRYFRIFTRIEIRNIYSSQRESAFKIMGLLAFSKRPLKKYEVQGFLALNEDGTVDYKNRALKDDIKDLCGCLVDVYGDTTDFVHKTVKQSVYQFLCMCSTYMGLTGLLEAYI